MAGSLTVVVSGSASSLLTSRVKVSSRCGWAALQAVSAAQAWKRLPKPARRSRQFPYARGNRFRERQIGALEPEVTHQRLEERCGHSRGHDDARGSDGTARGHDVRMFPREAGLGDRGAFENLRTTPGGSSGETESGAIRILIVASSRQRMPACARTATSSAMARAFNTVASRPAAFLAF